jgi:WD40 repeat protein
MLVSVSRDGTAALWDAESGKYLKEIGPFPREIASVAVSRNNLIAIGFGNDTQLHPFPSKHPVTIRVWQCEASGDTDREAVTLEERFTFDGLVGSVSALAFSPDGQSLIAGCDDCDVRRWDMTTGSQLKSLTGHAGPVSGVAFSSDGMRIAVAGGAYQNCEWFDGHIRLWNADTAQPIRDLSGHRSQVTSVAFSPDGQLLASSSSDRTVRV